MSLELKNDEQLIRKASVHWCFYLKIAIGAFLVASIIFSVLIALGEIDLLTSREVPCKFEEPKSNLWADKFEKRPSTCGERVLLFNKNFWTLVLFSETFLFLCIFIGPFLFSLLSNFNKTYILTTKRFYIEEGIISKSKANISLEKIKDVRLLQSNFQKKFGAGDLKIYTSSNSGPTLKCIAQVLLLKNDIDELISRKLKE
jgi:Bacterial PH domain